VNITAASSVAGLITPRSLEYHPTDRATTNDGDRFAAQQVEQFGLVSMNDGRIESSSGASTEVLSLPKIRSL